MSGIRIYLEKEKKSGASSSTLKEGQIERKRDKKGNRQWHEWLFLFRQSQTDNMNGNSGKFLHLEYTFGRIC